MLVRVAIIFMILLASTVQASQNDERLALLFKELQAAPSAGEAKVIEIQIRSIWMESEQEEINILMQKGSLALAMQEFPVAIQIFDLIVQKKPDFAEAWNKRAITHYLMENYDESAKDIQKVIVLEPRHFNAMSGLGFIHTKLGRYDEALKVFQKISEIYPKFEGLEMYLSCLKKAVEATRI
ncbi:MAG: tetratricopeptide repeat protein [SAR324 cluster bacterium]|nr:tetratricopeptide repeat protein [SAR324 cluster bacterium]